MSIDLARLITPVCSFADKPSGQRPNYVSQGTGETRGPRQFKRDRKQPKYEFVKQHLLPEHQPIRTVTKVLGHHPLERREPVHFEMWS